MYFPASKIPRLPLAPPSGPQTFPRQVQYAPKHTTHHHWSEGRERERQTYGSAALHDDVELSQLCCWYTARGRDLLPASHPHMMSPATVYELHDHLVRSVPQRHKSTRSSVLAEAMGHTATSGRRKKSRQLSNCLTSKGRKDGIKMS